MKKPTPKKSLLPFHYKNTQNSSGIAVLTKLHQKNEKIRYPSFPDGYRVIPKYSDKTANGLTRCIIDFIRLTGGQAERINCTGRVIDRRKTFTDAVGFRRTIGQARYIKTSGQVGTADISATIQGRSVKIEVKMGADKQRPEQRIYQAQVEASGGLYFIAKTFDQFYLWHIEYFGGVNL